MRVALRRRSRPPSRRGGKENRADEMSPQRSTPRRPRAIPLFPPAAGTNRPSPPARRKSTHSPPATSGTGAPDRSHPAKKSVRCRPEAQATRPPRGVPSFPRAGRTRPRSRLSRPEPQGPSREPWRGKPVGGTPYPPHAQTRFETVRRPPAPPPKVSPAPWRGEGHGRGGKVAPPPPPLHPRE